MVRGGRGVPSPGGRGKFVCPTQAPWERLARRRAPPDGIVSGEGDTWAPTRRWGQLRRDVRERGRGEGGGTGDSRSHPPAMPPRARLHRQQLCLPTAGTAAAAQRPAATVRGTRDRPAALRPVPSLLAEAAPGCGAVSRPGNGASSPGTTAAALPGAPPGLRESRGGGRDSPLGLRRVARRGLLWSKRQGRSRGGNDLAPNRLYPQGLGSKWGVRGAQPEGWGRGGSGKEWEGSGASPAGLKNKTTSL